MTPITLILNTSLRGLPAGATVTVETDDNGAPMDAYWDRRIEDAKFDNCVTIVGQEVQSATAPAQNKPARGDKR